MNDYTATQQAKLASMLRYAVAGSVSNLWLAQQELIESFGGDTNAALAAFGTVLLAYRRDPLRPAEIALPPSEMARYGAEGIDAGCGDVGREIEVVAPVVLPLKQMRSTPIPYGTYFSDDDSDDDGGGDDWTPCKYDDDTSRYPFRLP